MGSKESSQSLFFNKALVGRLLFTEVLAKN